MMMTIMIMMKMINFDKKFDDYFEVNFGDMYRWSDCIDGANVQMERMYRWSECIDGTNIQMERMYRWSECIDGVNVQMKRM